MSGTLYIVSTPIGNLEDITLRALRILRECDFILAEDTRVTRKLLDRYGIKKDLVRYDEHSHTAKAEWICKELETGKLIALVSDAGTPGVSDPGSRLVSYVRDRIPDIKIEGIPGPSALIAALSISGFSGDKFAFLGFPPHKKGRETFFKEIAICDETVIFYESPHRVVKALEQLKKFVNNGREILIAREITKIHETVYFGTIGKADKLLAKDEIRGEFVIVLGPQK